MFFFHMDKSNVLCSVIMLYSIYLALLILLLYNIELFVYSFLPFCCDLMLWIMNNKLISSTPISCSKIDKYFMNDCHWFDFFSSNWRGFSSLYLKLEVCLVAVPIKNSVSFASTEWWIIFCKNCFLKVHSLKFLTDTECELQHYWKRLEC